MTSQIETEGLRARPPVENGMPTSPMHLGNDQSCVLIVEDSRIWAGILAEQVHTVSLIPIRAASYQAAQRLLVDRSIKLIILDIDLGDGTNTGRLLLQDIDLRGSDIPVLIITGVIDEEDEEVAELAAFPQVREVIFKRQFKIKDFRQTVKKTALTQEQTVNSTTASVETGGKLPLLGNRDKRQFLRLALGSMMAVLILAADFAILGWIARGIPENLVTAVLSFGLPFNLVAIVFTLQVAKIINRKQLMTFYRMILGRMGGS